MDQRADREAAGFSSSRLGRSERRGRRGRPDEPGRETRRARQLLSPGGRRGRSTATAGGFRAVGDLRGVDGRRQRGRSPARRGRLPGHAGARRVRQLPQPAAGRLAASDDGAVPLAPAQPEGERRNGPRARRELRARGDAAVLDRPVPAQHRWQRADRRRQAAGDLYRRRHRRPRQGVHRLELVRRERQRRALLRPQQRTRPRPPMAADDQATTNSTRHRRSASSARPSVRRTSPTPRRA